MDASIAIRAVAGEILNTDGTLFPLGGCHRPRLGNNVVGRSRREWIGDVWRPAPLDRRMWRLHGFNGIIKREVSRMQARERGREGEGRIRGWEGTTVLRVLSRGKVHHIDVGYGYCIAHTLQWV